MKKQTSIAAGIDVTNRKAQYDQACKKLLANREILAWILKSVTQEFKNCSISEIVNQCIETSPEISAIPVYPGETNTVPPIRNIPPEILGGKNEDNVLGEGTVTYDIRFQACYPSGSQRIKVFVNVEAQKDFYPGYALQKRGIFYCCRMISAQYNTEFTEPDYDNIKKVYSIWICMNPSRQAANSITEYHIDKKQREGILPDKKENYDLMTLVILCLGGKESDQYQGILKLLDILLSEKKDTAEKKQILEQEFKISMTRNMEQEVNLMCNLSDGLIERTEARVTKEVTERVTKQVTQQIEKRFEEMIRLLLQSKRFDDLDKASKNREYRELLCREFGI